MGQIAVIRIHGRVDVNADIGQTLDRLKIRRKLVCVFIDEKDKVRMGMLMSVKDYVALGTVDEKLMKEVIEKRGQFDLKKKYRGFCRLHPPVGGFKKTTKLATPKGILGKHDDISKLLSRML